MTVGEKRKQFKLTMEGNHIVCLFDKEGMLLQDFAPVCLTDSCHNAVFSRVRKTSPSFYKVALYHQDGHVTANKKPLILLCACMKS